MKKKKLVVICIVVALALLLGGFLLWYFYFNEDRYLTYFIYQLEDGQIVSQVISGRNAKASTYPGETTLTKYVCKHPKACAQNHMPSSIWFMYDGGEVLYFDASRGPGEYQNVEEVVNYNLKIKFDDNLNAEKVSLSFFKYDDEEYFGAFGTDVKQDYRKFAVNTLTNYGNFSISPSELPSGVSYYNADVIFTKNTIKDGFVLVVKVITKENESYGSGETVISYLADNKFEKIVPNDGSVIDSYGIEEFDKYYKLSNSDSRNIIFSKGKEPKIILDSSQETYINSNSIYYIENNKLMSFDGQNKTNIEISNMKETYAIVYKYLVYYDTNDYLVLYDIESKEQMVISQTKIKLDYQPEFYEDENSIIFDLDDENYGTMLFNISTKTTSLFEYNEER